MGFLALMSLSRVIVVEVPIGFLLYLLRFQILTGLAVLVLYLFDFIDQMVSPIILNVRMSCQLQRVFPTYGFGHVALQQQNQRVELFCSSLCHQD
jgi:hypothetical protein